MNTETGMERAMAMVDDAELESEFDLAGGDVCSVLQKRFDNQEEKLKERAEAGKRMDKLGPLIRVFAAAKTKKRALLEKCDWANTPKKEDALAASVHAGMKEYSNCYDKTMALLEKK